MDSRSLRISVRSRQGVSNEPERYLGRVYRHHLSMKPKPHKKKFRMLELRELRALFIILWREGIKRQTRFQFWQQLFSILRYKPRLFGSYILNFAHLEHFIEYRQIVRDEIEAQLAEFIAVKAKTESETVDIKESSVSY